MNQPDEPQRVTPKGGFFKEVPDFQTEEKKNEAINSKTGTKPAVLSAFAYAPCCHPKRVLLPASC